MKHEPHVLTVLSLFFVGLSAPLQAQVSFRVPPTYAGGGCVFTADFNVDAKPDLLSCDGTLQLGNGDGTFRTGIRVSGGPLAVQDFNGDLKPDVLEFDKSTGTILVLLGNGDGTFQTPISTAAGAVLTPLAAIDLNGDGKADVLGVDLNSNLRVYLGNGDGTFTPGASYSLGVSGQTFDLLSLGDFNSDGKTDVAVSMSSGQEVVFLGNADGTFQPPKTSAGVGPSYTAVGDFNGDGKLDLAFSVAPFCYEGCYGAVYISLGNGDGTFRAPAEALSGFGPLAAIDLNGDGRSDLVFENIVQFHGTTVPLGQIHFSTGGGTFAGAETYLLSSNPGAPSDGSISVAIADFNGDGKPDVAMGNAVLLGNVDGTFQGIPLTVLPKPLALIPEAPNSFVIGKFTKNGANDVAAISGSSVYILSNDGAGQLSLTNTYTLQQPGYAIATAQFTSSGNLDLIVAGSDDTTSNWSYSILLGNGDGTFAAPIYYPQSVQENGSNARSIVTGDFNNDHKLDVAISFGPVGNQSLAVLLGNGDGTLGAPSYYFDGGSAVLLAADFNGDGNLDIAGGVPKGTSFGARTMLLFGNGDGTFQNAVFPADLTNVFEAFLAADLRNNGKSDLVGSGFNGGTGGVALGNGDGTFTLALGAPAYPIAVADFNGDGKLDLVDGNAGAIALGNGDGTFSSLIDIPTFGPVSPAIAIDMNGDGRPDLVFASGLTPVSGIAVLFNTTASSFELSASTVGNGQIMAGTAGTSTVTVYSNFGFNKAVTLSCPSLSNGVTCAFSPPSISSGTGISTLTITTSVGVATGLYTVQIQGSAGSIVNSTSVGFNVTAPNPDFSIAPAPGSPTSQTINAGQQASFTLALTPIGSFGETVNLSCVVSPALSSAPTCSLSSSQINFGLGAQQVTVSVGTVGPGSAGTVSYLNFPPAAVPLVWFSTLLISTGLWLCSRRRQPVLCGSVVILGVAFWVGCGGSSSSHTPPGTPAGTYTATVTATSSNLSHNTTLQVVVH